MDPENYAHRPIYVLNHEIALEYCYTFWNKFWIFIFIPLKFRLFCGVCVCEREWEKQRDRKRLSAGLLFNDRNGYLFNLICGCKTDTWIRCHLLLGSFVCHNHSYYDYKGYDKVGNLKRKRMTKNEDKVDIIWSFKWVWHNAKCTRLTDPLGIFDYHSICSLNSCACSSISFALSISVASTFVCKVCDYITLIVISFLKNARYLKTMNEIKNAWLSSFLCDDIVIESPLCDAGMTQRNRSSGSGICWPGLVW